jgi:hypothetical protein
MRVKPRDKLALKFGPMQVTAEGDEVVRRISKGVLLFLIVVAVCVFTVVMKKALF